MRRDSRNTGFLPLRGERRRGDRPWSYRTGRGIFSTPVLGADETVYVGSADTDFYALDRRGKRRWRFSTGGIIDAAAALGAAGPNGRFPITFGSGDETLYQLRSRGGLTRKQRIRWKFRTDLAPATGQLVNWWEGNPAYGPDGNIYVGNTGGGAFSLTPGGEQRWVVQRGNSVWTTPAFDAEGNSYWGSVDFFAFSLDPAGNLRWQTFTPGYVTSSPALGSDGTVYVGSFDRNLYALDPATGAVRWTFPTADHVYGSPALGAGDQRRDRGDLHRLGRRLGLRGDARGGAAVALRHRRAGPLLAGRRAGAARRAADRLRRLLERQALRARLRHRKAALVVRHHPRLAQARRPQRPQRLAGARPARRLHRRRARAGLVRPLRLLPPARPTAAATAAPATSSTPTSSAPSRSRPAAPPCAARSRRCRRGRCSPRGSSSAAAARRSTRGSTPAPARTRWSPRAPSSSSRPSSRATATTCSSAPTGSCRPTAPCGSGSPAIGPRTATRAASTTRCGSRPSARAATRARCGSAGRRVGAIELSRLALPLPSLLPSVNQIGFDSYDLIAGTLARERGRSPPRPDAALGDRRAVGERRGDGRRPRRRLRLPALRQLPRRRAGAQLGRGDAPVQLRPGAAAQLRRPRAPRPRRRLPAPARASTGR